MLEPSQFFYGPFFSSCILLLLSVTEFSPALTMSEAWYGNRCCVKTRWQALNGFHLALKLS